MNGFLGHLHTEGLGFNLSPTDVVYVSLRYYTLYSESSGSVCIYHLYCIYNMMCK